jgi:hypothetical protein
MTLKMTPWLRLSAAPVTWCAMGLIGCTSADPACEATTITLSGIVYDRDGLPDPDARVVARTSLEDETADQEARGSGARQVSQSSDEVTATTDESGAYTLTISRGNWSVWAWMEGDEDTGYGGGYGCESEVLEVNEEDCDDRTEDLTMDDCHFED